jgi:NitT/TauT family transport system ATP-binding protein
MVTPPATEAIGALQRVVVQGVTRVFYDGRRRVPALGPLDLTIEDGSFVCIVGPSGCGKSTLLRIVAGLIRPSAGEVLIRRRDPNHFLAAMVFQDHSVFPWKTVRQNVRFGLDIAGRLPRSTRDQQVDVWLERVGIRDFADAYPATLSGGMRQRVSIARALAVEPEILLMDEPFASLDAQLRLMLQQELVRLWESDRRTVIFVTHSLDEAIYLGDRVIVMTARPGVLRDDFKIPFGRPRDFSVRASAEFGELEQSIWSVLRSEVESQLAGAGSAEGR